MIDQTVAPNKQVTTNPVDLDKTQRSGEITSSKHRKMKGVRPGQISGPSLPVTVLIRNLKRR